MADPISHAPNRIWLGAGAALLLAIMASELFLAARQQSQTSDEGVHIVSGYESWKSFDFGFNPEHPPLVKLVAVLPLLWSNVRAPSAVPNIDIMGMEFSAGREFLYASNANTVLWRTRAAAAVFTICLGLAVFLVAYSIAGAGPAFLALGLLAFEPNFLAHGALVTTDVGATLGIFLGSAAFYFYLRKPTAIRLLGAGLAAGICLGTKHSGILLFPILAVLALAELVSWRDLMAGKLPPGFARRSLRLKAALVSIAGISLVVLWSLYGFRYAARPHGLSIDPALPGFAERHMHGVSTTILLGLARWHLLPESYLYGLGVASARGAVPTIIFGKYYPSTQWFYFPSVFAIKSTLAFLALLCLVPLSGVIRGKQFRRELLLLTIPPAVYFIVAISSGLNIGVRHLLPVYPFLIVLASIAAWNLALRNRRFAVFVALLVAFHVASSPMPTKLGAVRRKRTNFWRIRAWIGGRA
jgi:hypothetical protein